MRSFVEVMQKLMTMNHLFVSNGNALFTLLYKINNKFDVKMNVMFVFSTVIQGP